MSIRCHECGGSATTRTDDGVFVCKECLVKIDPTKSIRFYPLKHWKIWAFISILVFASSFYSIGTNAVEGGFNQVFRYPMEGLPVLSGLSLLCTLPFIVQTFWLFRRR